MVYPARMTHFIDTEEGRIEISHAPPADWQVPAWWHALTFQRAPAGTSPHPWQIQLATDQSIAGVPAFPVTHANRDQAVAVSKFQRLVLPAALSLFLEYEFRGTVLPLPYLGEESDGRWSSGLLLLGHSTAMKAGAEDATRKEAYETAFGPGATQLLLSFVHACTEAWAQAGLPPRKLGPLEVSPIDGSRSLFADFGVAENRLVHLPPQIDEDDPIWLPMRRSGSSVVWRIEGNS